MRAVSVFLVGTAFAATAPAFAQPAEPTQDDIVVTATGAPQESGTTGRSITVLERDTIERRQTLTVSDLLATTPGVTVTRSGSLGGLTAVRIRGAEGDHTLALIDGIRVNDPSSTGGAFDFANLLAGSVERIEVLRGPNSVAWGSQAIGGVVNVMTTPLTRDPSGRANIEYGYSDTVSANAAVSGGSDRIRIGLTGGYLRSDGISQADIGSERDGYRQYGATGRAEVQLAEDVSLDLRGYYAHSRVDLDGFVDIGNSNYVFKDTQEYAETQEAYGYAGLRAKLGPVSNTLSFTIADINRDNFDPAVGADPVFLGRGRTERVAYQGDAALLPQLRLIFGAERERSRFYDGFDTRRTGINSVYGQAVLTPVDWATLTAGLRYDDHDDFGQHSSWGGDVVVRPWSATLLRASYGEGFKAPTLYQLFSAYGNPELKPESATGYEFGIEQRLLRDKVKASLTWFHRKTRNQIDFFFNCSGAAAPQLCAKRPFGFYDNIAGSRSKGLEVAFDIAPTEDLTLSASYSFIDAENRSPGFNFGNTLARRPRDTASVSIDYRTPWGPSVGSTVQIVGDSYDDAGNFTRLDGHALASVRAEMPLTDKVVLYGRVENLFDADYQLVSGYGTYGRSAFAGVRVKLD